MSNAAKHHSINYVEITVTDLDAAKRFYGDAFGWQFNDYGPGYAGIRAVGVSDPSEEVGGLLLAEKARPAGGPFVILYSDNLDATADAVRIAGGEIVQGPYEFPGGRRLHFTDPSGNEIGVWAS